MVRRKSVPAETQPPEISAVVPADDDFVGTPEDGPNLIGDGSASSRRGESETAVEVAVETVVAVAVAVDATPSGTTEAAVEAAAVAEDCAARAKACLEAFAYQRQQLGPVVALVPHEAMMQGIRIAATAARERRQAYPACTPEAAVAAIEALPAAISDLNTLFGCYVNLARAAALGADIRDALASIDGRPGAIEPT